MTPRRRVSLHRLVHGLILLAIVALVADATHTLTRRPAIGLADNGDFWRVMHPAGIVHITELGDEHHTFVRRLFRTAPTDFASNPSSPALVALVARTVGWGFRDRADEVDIRQVGVLYLLLLVCALGVALALRVPPPLCLALTWVALDPSYLLFFNSFYSEPPAFIALLGVTVWFSTRHPFSDPPLSTRQGVTRALLIWALMIFGAFSRTPMLLFGVTVAVVLGCWWLASRPAWRPKALAAITLLVAVWPVVHYRCGPAIRFPVTNNFNALFRGITLLSARPERALATFDIPEEHWDLVGHHPREAPADLRDHVEKLSRLRLLGLYLTDPGAVWSGAAVTAARLVDGRLVRLGNFERSEDPDGDRQFSRPWQLSRARRWLFAWPWLAWIFVAAATAWSLVRLFRDHWASGASPLLLLLGTTVVSQAAVAVLGDGTFGLTRHLAVARMALDLMLVVVVAELVPVVVRWLARRRERSSGQL